MDTYPHGDMVSLVYLSLNKTSISTGDLHYEITWGPILNSGNKIIVLNTIIKKPNVDFGCNLTFENIQANATFKYGLSHWDSMIKQCGIINGLQAFGFTSYINYSNFALE